MRVKWAVVPAVAVLALTGCGGGSSSKTTSGSTSVPSASQSTAATGGQSTIGGLAFNNHGSKNVAGMSSIEVEADNFYFEPSVLIGTPGQHLAVNLKNSASIPHNFTLQAQNINKDLDPNSKASVQVTFPTSGVLSFWCEYHKNSGMAGGVKAS